MSMSGGQVYFHYLKLCFNFLFGFFYLSANIFPTRISFPAVAHVRNSLYIVGGWNGISNFDTIFLYNQEDDTWKLLPNRMRCPRRASTAMIVNSTIFGSCSLDK